MFRRLNIKYLAFNFIKDANHSSLMLLKGEKKIKTAEKEK